MYIYGCESRLLSNINTTSSCSLSTLLYQGLLGTETSGLLGSGNIRTARNENIRTSRNENIRTSRNGNIKTSRNENINGLLVHSVEVL